DAAGVTLSAGPHVVETQVAHQGASTTPAAASATTVHCQANADCSGWNIDQLTLTPPPAVARSRSQPPTPGWPPAAPPPAPSVRPPRRPPSPRPPPGPSRPSPSLRPAALRRRRPPRC